MPCRSRRINRWNYLQELRQVFIIPHPTCNLFLLLLLLLLFLNQCRRPQVSNLGVIGIVQSQQVSKRGITFKIADCSHVISRSCVQSKIHDAHVSPLSLDRYLGFTSGKFEMGAVLPDMEEQFQVCENFCDLNMGLNFSTKPWELHSAELLNSAAQAGSCVSCKFTCSRHQTRTAHTVRQN